MKAKIKQLVYISEKHRNYMILTLKVYLGMHVSLNPVSLPLHSSSPTFPYLESAVCFDQHKDNVPLWILPAYCSPNGTRIYKFCGEYNDGTLQYG